MVIFMIFASPHYLSRVKGYSQLLLCEARKGRDEWGKKVEEGELSSFVLDISFRFQFSSDLCHLLFALKLFFYWSNETRYWFQILSIKFSYFGLNSELHACNWAVMRDGAVNRQNDKQTDQGYDECDYMSVNNISTQELVKCNEMLSSS